MPGWVSDILTISSWMVANDCHRECLGRHSFQRNVNLRKRLTLARIPAIDVGMLAVLGNRLMVHCSADVLECGSLARGSVRVTFTFRVLGVLHVQVLYKH